METEDCLGPGVLPRACVQRRGEALVLTPGTSPLAHMLHLSVAQRRLPWSSTGFSWCRCQTQSVAGLHLLL